MEISALQKRERDQPTLRGRNEGREGCGVGLAADAGRIGKSRKEDRRGDGETGRR